MNNVQMYLKQVVEEHPVLSKLLLQIEDAGRCAVDSGEDNLIIRGYDVSPDGSTVLTALAVEDYELSAREKDRLVVDDITFCQLVGYLRMIGYEVIYDRSRGCDWDFRLVCFFADNDI